MKYTMTVWIDFEADTPDEARELAESFREVLLRTLRQLAISGWESEWAPAPNEEPS
jgi:hypothetical protein